MFSGTIDSCKWFLMKQTLHTMLACNSLQSLHDDLVVIYCDICFCINRSKLVLSRCNLIVLCFCRYTNFPEFDVNISHERCNSLTDCSEIMIIQFLSFWRHSSKQCTSCVDQIFSLHKFFCINQEVFLLWSYRWSYFFRCCISK